MDPALARAIEARPQTKALNELIINADSVIQRFYGGCTALVTGGSGFLGKQLVEKLLRSSDVKRIYLLLRPKKGKTVEDRFNALIQDPVFDEIRELKPKFFLKLMVVEGDLSLPKLGISDNVWNTIVLETDTVLHAAASVRFDEPLRIATLTNVRGTREVIRLAKDCQTLRCFVHVSTAYSNATRDRVRQDILEQFYPAPVSANLMIQMAETMDEAKLDAITPQLLGEWPNTYTFTKCIAEELILNEGRDLPVCVVRPSVVISSLAEPCPGWVDPSSAYGPSGIVLSIGLGVMHVMLADPDIQIDLIPVDIVNNAILAAGWETARRWSTGEKETKIYTVSSLRNRIMWREMMSQFDREGFNYLSPRSVWYATNVNIRNVHLYTLLAWHLHYLPAYVIDGVCGVFGITRIFVKLYKKVDKMTKTLSYFSCNEWRFSDDNLVKLHDSLSPVDKVVYNFDVKSIDWGHELIFWVLGARQYIVKDDLRGTKRACQKQEMFRVGHYFILFLYFWIYWKIFSFIFSVFV